MWWGCCFLISLEQLEQQQPPNQLFSVSLVPRMIFATSPKTTWTTTSKQQQQQNEELDGVVLTEGEAALVEAAVATAPLFCLPSFLFNLFASFAFYIFGLFLPISIYWTRSCSFPLSATLVYPYLPSVDDLRCDAMRCDGSCRLLCLTPTTSATYPRIVVSHSHSLAA